MTISNTSISSPIQNGSARNLIAMKTFKASFRRMLLTPNDINKAVLTRPYRPPYSAESVAISIFFSVLPFQLHFSSWYRGLSVTQDPGREIPTSLRQHKVRWHSVLKKLQGNRNRYYIIEDAPWQIIHSLCLRFPEGRVIANKPMNSKMEFQHILNFD